MAATMSTSTRDEAALSLYESERSRQAIRPLTETYPGLTVDDAYAIQLA